MVAALERVDEAVRAALTAEDFEAAMQALAGLRQPVDAFFETVTVNAEDGGVRARRLGLLARIRMVMERVAAFREIEG